jgi:hypothetical protein
MRQEAIMLWSFAHDRQTVARTPDGMKPWSPASAGLRGRSERTGDLALALVSGAAAFALLFLTLDSFPNDHYVHLARAQAMLAGDLPIRDYTEEGVPLTVALSALAQKALGPAPFAEFVLVLISFSAAAAVTFWAARQLTGSRVIGLLAALAQVVAFPRSYGHPKIVIYPVLFLLAWSYIRKPTRRHLAFLGAWTAIAFLLRHDHGVYSAIGGTTAVIAAHWPERWTSLARRTAAYAGMTLLFASPYFAYVQYHLGIVNYFRIGVAISGSEASRASRVWPGFHPIRGGPLLTRAMRTPDDLPAIHVRWGRELSEAERVAHERALGLLYPERRDDNGTWRYRVEPPARLTLAALVHLRDAEDTAGFDRASLELADRPRGVRRVLHAVGLDRLRRGPPVEDAFSQANATALVFYTLWLLPAVAVAAWVARRRAAPPPQSGREVLVLAVVAMVCTIGFVRDPFRVSDAFGAAPILGAWLIATVFFAPTTSRITRILLKSVAIIAGVVLLAATAAMGGLMNHLNDGDVLDGYAAIRERAARVFTSARTWPWADWWPGGGIYVLATYVDRCTAPGDRLLVTWNAPEFNVFSRRPFAGGETLLMPVNRPPAMYENAVLARLQRQTVPVVLARPDDEQAFASAYPRIAAHLADRYRIAGDVERDGLKVRVLVDRARTPIGPDPEFNLPCFREPDA